MKRILFVASRSDVGAGGEGYLLLLMRYIDRQRFEPIVLLPRAGTLEAALGEMGIEVIVEEAEHGWLKRPEPWYRLMESTEHYVRRCVSLLEDREVALVHTNSNFRVEAAMAAALCGVPHLYLAHIEFQPELPVFRRFVLEPASYARLMDQLSARIVAVSSSVAKSLSPPVSADRIEIVNNGVETERFDDSLRRCDGSFRRELELPVGSLLLVAIGRMARDKGFDVLLGAAAQVLPSAPNLHMALIGDEEDVEYVRQLRGMAAAAEGADRIRFLGFRADVPRILVEADLFALPSRREGHPYVLLEAMASDCAVVAARCPGVEETLIDRRDGLLVEIEDSSGLAEAILAVTSDERLRQSLARNARNRVRRHFHARTTAEKMMAIYSDLLSQPKPLPGAPGIELFLRASQEIGTLGIELTELRSRVRTLEQFMDQVKGNPLARLVRSAVKPFRTRRH